MYSLFLKGLHQYSLEIYDLFIFVKIENGLWGKA